MKSLNLRIVLIVLLLATFTSLSYSQNKVGTTSMQFLKITPGTRAAAMGDAIVSTGSTAEDIFDNPASLNEIPNFDIEISRVNWFVDTKISSFAVGYNLGNFSLGIFGEFVDYGTIEVTTVSSLKFNSSYTEFNPGLTGETINPNAFVAGITFAKQLTNKFSFGLSAKYARDNFIKAKASVFAFDGGVLYKTGYKSIQIGANIMNFGLNDVKFIDHANVTVENPNYDPTKDNPQDSLITEETSGQNFPIPQSFSFGISAYLISPEQSLFLHDNNIRLLLSYSLINPRDYDLQYEVGAELSFMNIFFLRSGYKFNFDEESITFGLGISYNKFNVGYSYDPFGTVIDAVQRFSLGYSF